MTPEQLTENLKSVLGANLHAVILYGSAAAGDQTKHFSNINLLVLLETNGVDVLDTLSPVLGQWRKAGNPTPLFLTDQILRCSLDVFPIEFLDIRDSHRVLFGNDPFPELVISSENLRHEIEFELRSKRIQLESKFLETDGKEARIRELIAKALSSVSTLLNATLRLAGGKPATKKKEVWAALNRLVPFDVEALEEIWKLRHGEKSSVPVRDLFSRLLDTLDRVTKYVDQFEPVKKECV